MKLAIIGSRTFQNFALLCAEADKLKPTLIVSGGARGADELAERYAEQRELPTKIFPAAWNDLNVPGAVIKTNAQGKQYNAMAGFHRNKDIVRVADVVLAFWDGKSRGTKHSIDFAHSIGKRVAVVRF
jgi:hypothetical protein